MGFRRVGGGDHLGGLDDVAGHTGAIIVLGDELGDQPETFGGESELFVYMGPYASRAGENADFCLPLTTFAEQEGTFTNVQGRIQRFWPGLLPPGSSRPGWLVLGALVAALTDADPPRRADQAFAMVASNVAELQGMTYGDLAQQGALMNQTANLSGD
jgi:NADH-quinone oxidoreductase subunit G